jgi:uncharacterized protein RhaS with RHS repeats
VVPSIKLGETLPGLSGYFDIRHQGEAFANGAYDALDRLTQACFTSACSGPGDNFRRYTYDAVGNRLTETTVNGTTTSTYDAADEQTQTSGPSGTTAHGYDADGNETSAGTATFTYALATTMKSAAVAGMTTNYTYDGDGNRVLASTGSQASKKTQYLWDPTTPLPTLLRETNGSNAAVRDYAIGTDLVGMVSGGNTYYFQRDGLGSIMALTSSTGATEWTYDYLPFGGAKSTTKVDRKAPTNAFGPLGPKSQADADAAFPRISYS